MRFKILLFIIVLGSCATSKKVNDQKSKKKVFIELTSFEKIGEYLKLDFAISNNTKKPITIVRHKSLEESGNLDGSPSFYFMDFLPYELVCEYEPMFMDQQPEGRMRLKYDSDFVVINSQDQYRFKVKSKDYLLGICDEKSKEVKVCIKYAPNKNIYNEEYFMKRYGTKKGASEYFLKLKDSFQTPIISDTLVVKY